MRPERRKGKQYSLMVSAVENKDVLKCLVKIGLYAMENSQKVEELFSIRLVDQCYEYQGFGYHQ